MNIKEAKDQAAREYAYDDWEELIFFNSMTADIEDYINRAIEICGQAQWNAAIEKAAVCAEIEKTGNSGSYLDASINKQSILKLKK